jgi:hypothetical protein
MNVKKIIVLTLIAIFGLSCGVNAPVVAPIRNTWVEGYIYLWSPVVFNLSCGFLISIFVWYLLVYRPFLKERSIIKNNIVVQYKRFKWNVINLLLHACGAENKSGQFIDDLCEYEEFRNYFDKDRWYAVLNGLSDENGYIESICLEMKIFHNDVSYVLNNVSFDNRDAHERFVILNENLFRLTQNYSSKDEHEKSITTFIRSLFAQISVVDGVLDRDVMQEMIDSI